MTGVRWLILLALLGAASMVGGRSAWAQTCTISTTPVAFGMYSVFNTAPLASNGTLTCSCSRRTNVTIWIGKGLYAPTNNPRQMAGGNERLDYNLYLDAAHTLIWGDPNPTQYGPVPVRRRNGLSVTVYGLIPAGRDVAAGSYTDSVIVTINY
jgi:spore coat protein U-like protein